MSMGRLALGARIVRRRAGAGAASVLRLLLTLRTLAFLLAATAALATGAALSLAWQRKALQVGQGHAL